MHGRGPLLLVSTSGAVRIDWSITRYWTWSFVDPRTSFLRLWQGEEYQPRRIERSVRFFFWISNDQVFIPCTDRFVCNNMIIIRTRQISPTIIHRPKRLTLVVEYEYGEQMQQWYRFCHQHTLAYLAYRTILPSFTASGQLPIGWAFRRVVFVSLLENESMEITDASMIAKQEPSIINPTENKPLPTIILARPLVDNFKLLRTLESR